MKFGSNHTVFICLALFLMQPLSCWAGVAWQSYLKAFNSGADDNFANDVSISGDTIVVGAPYEDGSGSGINPPTSEGRSNSGAAYVYYRDPVTGWGQQAYLKASVSVAEAYFGQSVAVSGNTVVIGSPGNNAVYVFVRSGSTWSQQALLQPPITTGGAFGFSVSIDGNTLVATATDHLSICGAYVFVRSGTTWSLQATLTGSNSEAGDFYGDTVDVSGDIVVVGAPWEDGSGTGINPPANNLAENAGAAYVYSRTGTTWTQQAYLKGANTEKDDIFGGGVAVSGQTIVVTARDEDGDGNKVNPPVNNSLPNSGAAYVFVRTAGVWSQEAYLKAHVSGNLDFFGSSIDIDGDTVIVGATHEDGTGFEVNPPHNDNGEFSGAAYSYKRLNGVWSYQSYLKAHNTSDLQYFGSSVAISNGTAVSAAPFDGTPQSGAAHVYTGLSPVPEIVIEHPVGADIEDGTGSIPFGGVLSGTSGAAKTFTIKNMGPSPLSVSSVSVTGANAGDFSINTVGMASSVPPTTGSTTFSVTFTPSATGARTAVIQITNSDDDEGIFDIMLTGTGLNNAPTISDIADQTIDEEGNTGALAFTIGDFETAASSLTVTRSSSNTTLVPTANIVLGGSGASRSVTVTPAANQSGAAIITVTVSDGATTTSDTFNLTVNAVNDTPTLNSITSPGAIQEDASQQTVLLSGISAGPNESQTLTVTATSNNTALIPNPTVSYTSPNTTGSVLYTPVANMSGTATITVTVDDGQATSNTTSQTFNVIVNAVNDAPTLDAITNPAAILEDAGQQTINLTGISSGPLEAQSLVITASSSNTSVIPNPAVQYTTPNATGTLTYTPVANASGTATITVTVNDQQVSNNTFSRTFTVTVNAVNDAPTISDIFSASTNEDTSTGVINFTVGDLESGPNPITLTGSSSNTTLVPDANIAFGGSGQFRTVSVTPAANQSGTATITVSVSDGVLSTSDTFVLTVNAVNDAPTLVAITNPAAIDEDSGQQAINLSGISAGPLESQALLVSVTSSNTALIPNPTVSYTSPSASGSLSYTPVANANGTATITVTVNDQQAANNTFSRTFIVTVNAVNDAPTISNITDRSVNEDTSTGLIAFTIGDLETPTSSLTVTRSSNNPTLVPVTSIVLGGGGANRTLNVSPTTNQSGTAIITITVSDGSLTASDSFVLTVNSTNDTPTISSIANQEITYNTLSNTLNFTVTDSETAAASLVVTGASSNQALLPDANIFLSGSGSSRGVTLVPAFNQTGVATVTLLVSDGTASTTTSFTLTVNAPEIVVEQPFASGITAGGTRGFGNVAVSSNSSLVFYIRNTNAATLTGLTITKDGTDASQFIITASPVSPVTGPGGNTAFTVQFAPTSAGTKTCALHIANNDPDENPFDITLTGNGTVPQTNWRQTYFGTTSNSGNAADLADHDEDGIPNIVEYAFGLHPGQNSAGQVPQPVRSGGDLVYTFTEPAGVTGITYSAEWSQTLQSGSWTSAGITHTVNNGLHTFTLPVGAAPGAFIRLRVTSL